ncbi:hypothetical protein AOLI_G00040200 [Acnodon oligacanthus]
MAQSKEVVPYKLWDTRFVEELVPCSQQVSMLYHLSYLCLAKFPKLERLLRMRAVETQLLFVSSEAVMLKCASTSQNLVSSLFPMLTLAIERNKPMLAVRYLEKAKMWIKEITDDVKQIAERYNEHNKNLATTTSDIITGKKNIKKASTALSQEIEIIDKTLMDLESQKTQATEELEKTEEQMVSKRNEIEGLVAAESIAGSFLQILICLLPDIWFFIILIQLVAGSAMTINTKSLELDLNQLGTEKNSLKQKVWNLELKIFDWQMKRDTLQNSKDSLPGLQQFELVQRCLTKIQDILIQLKGFWDNVSSLLDTMKNKTFVNEDLIEDPELHDVFLKSIQTASEMWEKFGGSSVKAVEIFRVQSKGAYSFLETDPSSLSEEEWQTEFNKVKYQLQQLKVYVVTTAPAIAERRCKRECASPDQAIG